ncbi:MAG: NAD(P)/FAD-dependent oxidoreductase [Acidimicrobiales bacterium]
MTARVAVVGGGPAGLMAAEVLAGGGVDVVVFDRMPTPGRKLLRAGWGGLNLTHSEPLPALLDRYGPARDRLAPAIEAFDPAALRAWCESLGLDTMVGSSGRVFPVGLRAAPLLRAWLGRLGELGVELRLGHRWHGWTDDGALELTDSAGATTTVEADATVLALGGASWSRLGSDGAWVEPVAAAGIDVVPLRPANCGFVVAWTAPFRDRFQGVPLKDVALSHGRLRSRGDAVVTATGLEGGAVYGVSRAVREALEAGRPATLRIDLRPDQTVAELAERLRRHRPKDSRATAMRRGARFQPVDIGLLREVTGNRLPDEPEDLARLAKRLDVTTTAAQPLDRAISTAGGIALDEVDDTFMLRRRPGTFVAGEMLDWEAPTGGYLLQATFSSAVAAATGALAWLHGG